MPNWLSRRVLMIALLLSMITAILAYWYLSENVHQVPADAGPVQDVVVAVQDIPADTRLSREMVTVHKVPARYVQPSAAQSVDEVAGKVATVALLQGEQVLISRLAGEDAPKNRLAYSIPEGHRAITIQVNEITGVAGFPTVGDRVDILVTYGDTPTTKTLLQNVMILATGAVTSTQDDGQQRIVPSLTLSVTPADAQLIAQAGSIGNMRVILRSPVEEGTVSLPPTTQI